jgi:dihydrofolate reductase
MQSTRLPVILVVAVAENGVIGVDGGLPWRIREDLRRFRAVTMGKPLLMGRATYESIGRPLDGRDNIVLTRQPDFTAEAVIVAHDLASALQIGEERAQARDAAELCVIGGAALFSETLPIAQRVHLTQVEGAPHGDVFFPALSDTEWTAVSREPLPSHEGDTARGTYVLYERRS